MTEEESNEEFARIVYGVYDRVYILKTCIEKGVESLQEFQSVCREMHLEEYEDDPKVLEALRAWNNLWHAYELPPYYTSN